MTASFQASLCRAAVAMALSSSGAAFAEIPNRTIKGVRPDDDCER
jgi:hypothetical protein